MEMITKKEILLILGLADYPIHSLLWYSENYSNLEEIIKQQIHEDLKKHKIFPSEYLGMPKGKREFVFREILVKNKKYIFKNIFTVQKHDSDKGLISDEHEFNNLDQAIEYFLLHSYCAGGNILKFTRR
jgi:hypothetical protein